MEKLIDIFNNLLRVTDKEIFDVRRKFVVSVFVRRDNSRFVLLPYKDKTIQVSYPLILLYIEKRFFLPFDLWEKVKVEMLDDNPHNLKLDNLCLRYPKEGIEHETYKGYYYIPEFELNVINRKGDCIDVTTGKHFKPIITDNAKEQNKTYPTIRLNIGNVTGGQTAKLVHRILAIVFLEPPKGYTNLIVDHINGKKFDYRLENLEWVTSQENNRRAVQTGLRGDGTRVVVLDKETGKVNEYGSLTELARELGVHPQYIVDGKNNKNQTYKRRYVIKDIDDLRDWDYFEKIELSGAAIGIKARAISTGEVTHYKSTKQAGKLTNTHQNAIAQYFRNKSEPAIINGYEFKLENDSTPWHEFNEYQLEIYRRGMHRNTKVYRYTDINTNESKICYGWKPLADLTGSYKKQIILAGKNNRVLHNKYRLEILN